MYVFILCTRIPTPDSACFLMQQWKKTCPTVQFRFIRPRIKHFNKTYHDSNKGGTHLVLPALPEGKSRRDNFACYGHQGSSEDDISVSVTRKCS